MKKFSMFVIAALCAISLSSCGDDSSSSSNNANPGASASPSASLSPSASASADGSSYDTAIKLTTSTTDLNITANQKVYFYVDAKSSTRYIFRDNNWDTSTYSATVSIAILDNTHATVAAAPISRTTTASGITGTTTTSARYYFVATCLLPGNYDLYLQNE
jgi:hypothetical protein